MRRPTKARFGASVRLAWPAPDSATTFRYVTLTRLAGTRSIPWWTLTVTAENLVVRRRLVGTEHTFDRTAALLMPARASFRGRPLTVRRDGKLDWIVRVARPRALAAALKDAGWPVDDR